MSAKVLSLDEARRRLPARRSDGRAGPCAHTPPTARRARHLTGLDKAFAALEDCAGASFCERVETFQRTWREESARERRPAKAVELASHRPEGANR